MAIKLEKYVRTGGELTSHGTVVETTGPKGSIKTLRKNFFNLEKLVAVILSDGKDLSKVIACSKPVSIELRAGRMVADDLFDLEILEDDKGRLFICMPSDGSVQEFKAANHKAKAKPSAAFMPTATIG